MAEETFQPDALGEPEFLERTREVLALAEIYQAAKKGGKRSVILVGPEGIGKTRLFETFRKQAIPAEEKVFTAVFGEGPPIPARPIVLLLARVYRHFGNLPDKVTQSARDLQLDLGMIEFIASKYRDNVTDDVVSQIHGTPQQFWAGMTQYLIEHARLRQVNVLLENLERADVASIEFLEWFLRAKDEKGLRLFCCATYRGDEKLGENTFQRVFPKVKKAEGLAVLEVPPLLARSVGSFVSSVLGRVHADERVYQEALRISRGNPMMLLAFLRSLASKGLIVKKGGAWRIESAGAEISALPKEMEERLVAGAAKLGKKHRDALEWSAVAGEGFTQALVGTLTGVPPVQLGFVVTDLLRERYWDELEGPAPKVFAFPSPDVRKAIYQGVVEKTRTKMHLAVARELEKESPPPAARLAWHYRAGQTPKKEQAWALEAGRREFLRADWPGAEAHFQRALELAREGKKPPEVAESAWWLARAAARLRELARADETLKEGLRAAAQSKGTFEAELRREQGLLRYVQRDHEAAFKLLKGIQEAGGEGARDPHLLVALADLYRLKNRPARARELLASVDRAHPELGLARGSLELLEARLAVFEGGWERARAALDRAEEALREQKEFGALAQALFVRAELEEAAGTLPEALARAESGTAHAESHGDPGIRARLWALKARLLQKAALVEESQQALARARALARDSGRERIEAYVNLEIARWCVHAKTFDSGLAGGRKALEVFDRLPDRWGGAGAYHALGRLYVRQDNLVQAEKYFEFARKYYEELGTRWPAAWIAAHQASLAAKQGRADVRAKLLEEGLALAKKHGLAEARGLLLVERGKHAADREEGRKALEEGFRVLKEYGNRLEAAQAKKLLKQDRPPTDSEAPE